jgi:hypothetical protein
VELVSLQLLVSTPTFADHLGEHPFQFRVTSLLSNQALNKRGVCLAAKVCDKFIHHFADRFRS